MNYSCYLCLQHDCQYLDLLLLCVKHVGIHRQRPQDAHHQLLLLQPLRELWLGRLEELQHAGRLLQVLFPDLHGALDLLPS